LNEENSELFIINSEEEEEEDKKDAKIFNGYNNLRTDSNSHSFPILSQKKDSSSLKQLIIDHQYSSNLNIPFLSQNKRKSANIEEKEKGFDQKNSNARNYEEKEEDFNQNMNLNHQTNQK